MGDIQVRDCFPYHAVMHWGTILTVTGAGVAAALAFVGTQWATRRQLKAALEARLDGDAVEHRRWLRDRRVAVYVDLLNAVEDAQDEFAKPGDTHAFVA